MERDLIIKSNPGYAIIRMSYDTAYMYVQVLWYQWL